MFHLTSDCSRKNYHKRSESEEESEEEEQLQDSLQMWIFPPIKGQLIWLSLIVKPQT